MMTKKCSSLVKRVDIKISKIGNGKEKQTQGYSSAYIMYIYVMFVMHNFPKFVRKCLFPLGDYFG